MQYGACVEQIDLGCRNGVLKKLVKRKSLDK